MEGERYQNAPVKKERSGVPSQSVDVDYANIETLPVVKTPPGTRAYSNAQYDLVEDMSPIDLGSEDDDPEKMSAVIVDEKKKVGQGDEIFRVQNDYGAAGDKKPIDDLNDKEPGALPWEMNYKLEDIPSWYDTLILGFQVYLMMAGTTVSLPFVLTRKMCMDDGDINRPNIVSTFVFVSGIITILQSSFGTRLPIVQGGSTAFLIPSLAILESSTWKCNSLEMEGFTPEQKTEYWQVRMREIQGAIIVASLIQVFMGFFGIVGLILRFITPMTIAPSITMIGLSLFWVAGEPAGKHWPISLATIFMIVLFSQYLRKIKVPIPFTRSPKRAGWKRYQIFQNLPILFGMAVMWAFCAIMTVSGGFEEGSPARTDLNYEVIQKSGWFRVPYPFQWGVPTVTFGAVIGIMAGVISGIIESLGDYYACARLVGSRAPPVHAINRGVFVEGLGCIMAGIWGTGNGTTSYSENIGAIGVTQVGSRRVIQVGGLLMIVFSLFGKLNAIFVNIPEPIVGAFLVVVFSIVTAVGFSNLRGVDLNSSRNIFIIGFSIFFSLTISQWMRGHPNVIQLGNDNLNQMVQTFLSTGMFLGGFFGFVLDNTIPGTRKERGLDEWEKQFKAPKTDNELEVKVEDPYDLPFIMPFLQKTEFSKWIPVSPTFDPAKYQALLRRTFYFRRRQPQQS